MKKIFIKKLTLKGFKNIKEEKVFTFETENIFAGGNATGKTTIADAICWVLTGKFFENIKNSFEFLNKDSNEAVVSIEIETECGIVSIYRKFKNDSTTIKLNNKKISQKKLQEVVDGNLFTMIFNPLVFLNKKPMESKAIIEDLLKPSINEDDAFKQLSSSEQKNLIGIDLKDENILKFLRKENSIKEKETLLKENEISLKKKELEMIVIGEKKSINEIKISEKSNEFQKLLIELKSEKEENILEKLQIQNLIKEKAKSSFSLFDEKILLNEKVQLEKDYNRISNESFNELNQTSLLKELEFKKEKFDDITKETAILKRQYVELNQKKCKCPMCGSEIKENSIEFKKNIENKKSEIAKKGQSNNKLLADLSLETEELLNKINKIRNETEEKIKVFNKTKEKSLEEIKLKIIQINKKLEKIKIEKLNFEKNKNLEINKMKIQLDEFEKIINEKSQKIENVLNLKKEEDSLMEDLKLKNVEIEIFNKNIETLIRNKKILENQINDLIFDTNKTKDEIEQNKKSIKSLIIFNEKKIELIENSISKAFNNVSFKLEKIDEISGEIKSCFEVLYNNKRMDCCSLSETIKAGLEISEMLSKELNVDFPVFIDNGESVLSIKTKINQFIKTIVVDIDDIKSIDEKILSIAKNESKKIILNA